MGALLGDQRPMIRKSGLVTKELPDEILVYDVERNRAHSLHRIAAAIWRRCDGTLSATEIAAGVQAETQANVDEAVVWHTLRELGTARLLERPVEALPAEGRITRREVMRRLGMSAALAVPLISSLAVPAAAQVASCLPEGSPCTILPGGGDLCCDPELSCVQGVCVD